MCYHVFSTKTIQGHDVHRRSSGYICEHEIENEVRANRFQSTKTLGYPKNALYILIKCYTKNI